MQLKFCSKGWTRKRATLLLFLSVSAARLCAFQSEDLTAISRQVKELMAQGRFEQAIPLCEQLVRALPGNAGLVLNLGLAEQMAGHPERAIPRFEEVLKAEPNSVPALSSLASSHLQLDQPKAAIPPLKKLLVLQPSNHEAREMLAGALLGAAESDDAAVQYRKLTADAPADAKAWYGLGKTYQDLSARLSDRLTKNGPRSAYVAALIGSSRLKSQQYQSAFFFFKEAQRERPDLRGVHSSLAAIYRKAGHSDWAAIEEQEEDQAPAPNCATNPSECFFARNRYPEAAAAVSPHSSDGELYWAIKAYGQMADEAFARVEALPESVELHAWRATQAHSRSHDLEAATEWRAALKLSPGNHNLERELATSLFLAHDYSSAVPMIEIQMKLDGNSPELNFMMGESLLRIEQPDNAVPYLETALRENPNMLPARASLGLSLAKLKRDREAIPHLEAALEMDDDGALHYQLAQAYERTGNSARAEALMAQYQDIQKRNQQEKEELSNDVRITGPYAK
jgi:tetratricopeptide (TPR) repeat protein